MRHRSLMLEDNARRDNAVGSRGLPATLSPKPAGPDIYLLTSPFRALPSAAILRLTYRDSSHPEAPLRIMESRLTTLHLIVLRYCISARDRQTNNADKSGPNLHSSAQQ